jgi:hypothetical protein
MGYRGAGMPGPGRRPEPSWPTVIATTIRLWAERHPITGAWALRGRGVLAVAVVIALGAAIAGVFIERGLAVREDTSSGVATSSGAATPATAGTSTAVRSGSPASAPPGSSSALGVSAAARDQTAHWIAAQVAASAIVACDPAMCATLQASGITAGRLLALGTAVGDPLGSDVVVATPAVRSQFGARLDGVYAPAVIASFGSGAVRIDVRAIAPSGAAAYEAALATDLNARISAGHQLLSNRRIIIPAAARKVLIAGGVDPRVLTTLAALAAEQPVRVLSFSDPSPGASSAEPLRGMLVAPLASGSRANPSLRSMLSFLSQQRPPFAPLRASIAHATTLSVEYAAPSPLGLFGGQGGQ